MTKQQTRKTRSRQEGGFALILAILALMLLTSLGLSLSATTSTEMQIAVNHRWSEQARYNAEAGVEFAKEFLSTTADWGTILPPARVGTWTMTTTLSGTMATDATRQRADEWGNPSRNFESYSCDQRGYGRGYGVVLDDSTAEGPYQFKQDVGGLVLNGAFTLWVRRPVRWMSDSGATATTLQDYTGNDALILVSEGVAPFTNTGSRSANRASHIIEVLLSQGALGQTIVVPGESQCSSRQGQAGGSAQGTNSAGCTTLTGAATLTTALAGATNLGTGNLK